MGSFWNANGEQIDSRVAMYHRTAAGLWIPQKAAVTGEVQTQITTIERALAFSTTTPLAANAVYTSPTVDVINYKAMNHRAYSDQGGTMVIQQSDDGATWDQSGSITVTAATVSMTIATIHLKYIRYVYTNGASPQTTFRFSLYLAPL